MLTPTCSNDGVTDTEQQLLKELCVDDIDWKDIAMETVGLCTACRRATVMCSGLCAHGYLIQLIYIRSLNAASQQQIVGRGGSVL